MVPDFDAKAIRVRRRIPPGEPVEDKVYLALQLDAPLSAELPSRCAIEDVERTVEERDVSFDAKTGRRREKVNVRKVVSPSQVFRFTEREDSHWHGGSIRAARGDFLVKDGDTFFVVPEVIKATKQPVFWSRFELVR